MTQNGETSSFCNVESKDLGLCVPLDHETAIYKSQFCENWCVAWSPECSYVAWSQGGGIVYLLPWNANKGKLEKRPSRDRSFDDLTRIKDESLYIQGLPRLPNHDTGDDLQWIQSHDNNDNIKSNLPFNSLNNKNKKNAHTDGQERSCIRIDCMDNVWSLAFGNGISEDSNLNIWRRFHFKSDLILATGLQGGTIKLWNVFTGHLLMELLDHKSIVRGLSFTSDGSFKLVSCSNDCTIKFWDLNQDGNMYKTLRFRENSMVFDVKWSPNAKHVAAVGMNRCAYIFDATNLKSPPMKLVGHHHNVCSCDFSPDGALLATASFDTRVIIWDPYTGDMIKSLGHLFPPPRPIYAGGANDHHVRDLSFSSDGQHIATVADDGYLRIWNVHDDSENPKCIASTENPLACSYSPNSPVIATGLRKDGKLEIYLPPSPSVARLQHLCRMAARRRLDTHKIDSLHFPLRLKEYLKYKLL